MQNPVIIALDFSTAQETLEFLEKFNGEKLFVKIGMELYYQEGPSIVKKIKEKGHQIFLDLKLHDIPNTVYKAMKGISRLGVDLVTVHAAGGREMMCAAVKGLEEGKFGSVRPKCVAVTQLTSTSQEQMEAEQLIHVPLKESVFHYASLAKNAGLDGVISSVHEASKLKELGDDFLIITPGIRLKEDGIGDQKRVADPTAARVMGSTGIVVGRSITKKNDPYSAYRKIKKAWELVNL